MTRFCYVSDLCLCFLFPSPGVAEKIKRYVEMFSLLLLVHEISVAVDLLNFSI
jgi:hypothetical protein